MTNKEQTKEQMPLRIFIGYDRRIPIIFHVASHSILKNSSVPVSITPLAINHFDGLLKRELDPNQSTEFSFSRFLVPYLSGYQGWSLFMDNDMLVVDDIAELWAQRDDQYAIQVIKHDHKPKEGTKFLGERQTSYEKKNWSSVVLFNNAKCKALTPDYVSSASGLQLHQFKWLENDDLIGELPHKWNHLVDYDPEVAIEELANLHYTSGGPYFEETKGCGYARDWEDMRDAMLMWKLVSLNKPVFKKAHSSALLPHSLG